jgi:predicted ATP-binding protein involved in virulence
MYINKIKIQNIRSISHLEMTFDDNHAGWHVLIGDNGTGKSTVIKSIALALIGANEAKGLRLDWNRFLREEEFIFDAVDEEGNEGHQMVTGNLDGISTLSLVDIQNARYSIGIQIGNKPSDPNKKGIDFSNPYPDIYDFKKITEIKMFSVAYGPMRRFSGGDDFVEVQQSNPKLFAHLSAFEESFVLSEPIQWLKNLKFQKLENDKEGKVIDEILTFFNDTNLLPNNTKIESVSSKGVFFKDINGSIISINDLSDGYRSVLSMTFEIIRQMILQYGSDLVFESIRKGDMRIMLPGIVLIDEIDAHLHPTWQTKIGEWFLKYFPKIQFIVTTHSPLICRAAEHGTIWKLSSSDNGNVINEIKGVEKDRLVFGNILDAFGTDAFGEVSRSESSQKKLEKLARLNMLQTLGKLDKSKEQELQDLKKIFSTDDTFKI